MASAPRRILLLGANGQVGQELRRTLTTLGEVMAYSRHEADLSQPHRLAELVAALRPDVIVNAAAYTAVDKAQAEPELAHTVNCGAVKALAEAAAEHDSWLIHYSTDYVFDGSKGTPYLETDPTAPLNVYGETKRAGEEAIAASGCRHLIFRTSWVYALHGKNFLKTILGKAAQVDSLNIVSDQTGAPTGAALIAAITGLCIYRLLTDRELAGKASGLYHLTAGGVTSWYDYAGFAVAEAAKSGWALKASADRIMPVPASQYPTPATRPMYSVLDCGKLCATFGLVLPSWQAGVASVIADLPKPVQE